MSVLTIGKLAAATGTKVETVRYYERAGLITAPARTGGNYRSYRSDDLKRLRFIRRTRDLGFSLDEIRALLGMAEQRDRHCGMVDNMAARHLEEIDLKIADLTALRKELAGAISKCAGGTMANVGSWRRSRLAPSDPDAACRRGRFPSGAIGIAVYLSGRDDRFFRLAEWPAAS